MKFAMKQLSLLAILMVMVSTADAQRRRSSTPAPTQSSAFNEETFDGLELRNIGPAFMSGRIADLAIHPEDESIWYVAVGSGGVWKTVNAGTTFTPIFDEEGSYSIGSVALDPNNPHVVWVGTGEHGGGRHFGYGDGIYKSEDGGTTWKNMGLPKSEHIGEIIVHPGNSDVIYVASQGPLWSPGGERGFYKSTDGGATWKKTLGDEEFTGVTDIVVDPRDANTVYAATWQHHRTVASLMDGGTKSAIYKSTDAGESWTQLVNGLPTGKLGKIGLAVSFQHPDIVYAAIELNRRKGGIWKSTDRGGNWEKQSDAISGGTGPHYYVELYASPHHFDRLYMMDASMQFSTDGGKTWKNINRQHRHGDNHALAFKASDPNYIMVGTDGGVYESFDLAENWRYMPNLPVTQFYKLAVDDAEPFYNIYSGTQDNSTQGGPSRTDNVQGIQNSDWRVVLNWDGHAPATEPGNPDIIYAERQEGNLARIDMTTGEVVDIQPQPGADEDYERFNWDAPIHVSPHKPTRLYFASQRVWKSENRGDSWEAISGDLTRNEERFALPIMGSTQSWDSPWDVLAMSNYNTITSLSESPKVEGLLYAGTDDGLLQVTEDNGGSWRKVEASTMGVPATAFVNDIKADMFDDNTVYVCLDNHKYGDYTPYMVKSTDRGRTWTSIRSNIPDRTVVWRVIQDHVKPGLMFAATEFGIYFTINGGQQWTMMTGGVPTISFRDIVIQRRENDLVAASFGRGFFIFDDISVFREVTEASLQAEATLFSSRKALWYVPRSHLNFDSQKGSMGAQHYVAPNPDFGAVFTYYLKDDLQSKAQIRQAKEKNGSASFPGWDAVEAEAREDAPKIWITVKDSKGNVVRRVEGSTKKGFHRTAWDLRYPSPTSMGLNGGDGAKGLMAAPGYYTATISKYVDGTHTTLGEPMNFEVVPLRKGALEGATPAEVAAFWRAYEEAVGKATAIDISMSSAMKRINAMQKALAKSEAAPGALDDRIHALKQKVLAVEADLNGMAAKREPGEKTKPTISQRLFAVDRGISLSTYGPTQTSREQLDIANTEITRMTKTLSDLDAELKSAGKVLVAAGAPWVEGTGL
ncbi:MAG: glycosyl hydrolase [Cyclobacteriaceae bacterium]